MDTEILLLVKYLILGIFQGFTEPIPISSSGHLVVLQHLLGMEIKGLNFELFVNTASLIAVLFIYRNDLIRLTKNGLNYMVTKNPENKSDFRFIIYLVIATIPAGVIGVLFNDVIAEYFKGIQVIGITLFLTGIALWFIRNLKGKRHDNDLKIKDAVIIGLAQAIALIPGISRSGATIVAAMGLGVNQATALRFSFLMYIPISVGGAILSFSDFVSDPELQTYLIPYILAFIGSLVASYFSLKWFMNIMAKGKLIYFSIYCLIVGPIITIFLR